MDIETTEPTVDGCTCGVGDGDNPYGHWSNCQAPLVIATNLRVVEAAGGLSGALTEAECTLLRGIIYRLRHRIGDDRGEPDLDELSHGMIRRAAAEIEKEANR